MRLIDKEKMQLNKKGIYEDVRRDIQRTQTLHSSKNLSGGNPLEVPSMSKKRNHDANDHYYHEISNSARMPTHNYQVHLKNLLENHSTEHDYKVLKTKQRIKEENEMLQNEMTRIRQMRKNHRMTDYGSNVEHMRRRIDEYKQWIRGDEW